MILVCNKSSKPILTGFYKFGGFIQNSKGERLGMVLKTDFFKIYIYYNKSNNYLNN